MILYYIILCYTDVDPDEAGASPPRILCAVAYDPGYDSNTLVIVIVVVVIVVVVVVIIIVVVVVVVIVVVVIIIVVITVRVDPGYDVSPGGAIARIPLPFSWVMNWGTHTYRYTHT